MHHPSIEQTLEVAFELKSRRKSCLTYEIEMLGFWSRDLPVLSVGAYALVNNGSIELGMSKSIPRRMGKRWFQSRWAKKALILNPSGHSRVNAACIEVYCINTRARNGTGSRSLRNMWGRRSLGGRVFPPYLPIYGLGDRWLKALLDHLEQPRMTREGRDCSPD